MNIHHGGTEIGRQIGAFFFLAALILTSCDSKKAEDRSGEGKKDVGGTLTEVQKSLDLMSGKEVEEKTDPMDGTKTFILTMVASEGNGVMIVRCSHATAAEAYIAFDDMVESTEGRASVRVKFDDNQPVREFWSESKDYKALFSPTPKSLLNRLNGAKIFMFEHDEFHGATRVTKFDLAGIHEGLPKLVAACQLK